MFVKLLVCLVFQYWLMVLLLVDGVYGGVICAGYCFSFVVFLGLWDGGLEGRKEEILT